ncbi:MAG: lytic transglycosylase domain-containing protein [Patescibacteria group bacterium]|nr:lytic transglycosylase domain-containing protein [Patescibacteria group bacterium]
MIKIRSAIKTLIVSFVLVVVVVAGYFYLPGVLGDSVFPLEYEDTIKKWCKEYNEDPFLVAGIIMQESGFNPQAKSYAGAMGIMQIMPTTGMSIAKGVGITNFSTDMLYNPEIAIQMGTWHIHVLKEKYGGSVPAALAAYNAGTGNADKWIRMGILNDLPYGETRKYVANVQEYMQVYHKLYQDRLELTDEPVGEPMPIVKKQEEPSTAVVWGRMLKELVNVFYNVE